jgi:hypothetical protein
VLQEAGVIDSKGDMKVHSKGVRGAEKWDLHLIHIDPSGMIQTLRSEARDKYPDKEYLPFGLEQYRKSAP